MAREKETRRAKTKARILLVEDHAMVRFGLTQLINQQADLAVCGEADSVPGALEAVATLKPDLAIVDLTLKGSNGLELIKTLAAQYPKLSVLVVSMHDESLNAELALHAGAKGYIMKEEAIEKMLVALRRVLSGKIYLSDNITLKLLQKQISGRKEIKATPVELLGRPGPLGIDAPPAYDTDFYLRLLARSVETLLAPFGYEEDAVLDWLRGRSTAPKRNSPRPLVDESTPRFVRTGRLLASKLAP